MAAPPLTLERAHAIDAPLTDFDDWRSDLTFGLCTACGRDAWSGTTGWWHADGPAICPDHGKRRPTFSPDALEETP